MREELPGLRRRMWAGGGLFVAMLVANAIAFGGAGYIVATAPLGWLLFGAYRWVQLKDLLSKHAEWR